MSLSNKSRCYSMCTTDGAGNQAASNQAVNSLDVMPIAARHQLASPDNREAPAAGLTAKADDEGAGADDRKAAAAEVVVVDDEGSGADDHKAAAAEVIIVDEEGAGPNGPKAAAAKVVVVDDEGSGADDHEAAAADDVNVDEAAAAAASALTRAAVRSAEVVANPTPAVDVGAVPRRYNKRSKHSRRYHLPRFVPKAPRMMVVAHRAPRIVADPPTPPPRMAGSAAGSTSTDGEEESDDDETNGEGTADDNVQDTEDEDNAL